MSDIIPIEGLNSLIDLFVNERLKNKNFIENNQNVTQEPNIKTDNNEILFEDDILGIDEFAEAYEGEGNIEVNLEEEEEEEERIEPNLESISLSLIPELDLSSTPTISPTVTPTLTPTLTPILSTTSAPLPVSIKEQESKQEIEGDNIYERIVMNKIKNEAKQKANKRKRGQSDMKKGKKESDKNSKDTEVNEARGKRKKVSVACILCRRSHLSCDNKRPCSRCVAKGVPNLCKDAPRKLTNPLKCTACPIFPDLTPAELQRKIHKMYELQKQQDEIIKHLTNSKTVAPELIEQIKDISSANLLHYANNMASPNNLGNYIESSADDINIEYDTNLFPIQKEEVTPIEDIGKKSE